MINRLIHLEEEVIRLTRELAEAKARAGSANASLPDGWVAVPVEPTPEMIKAMNNDEWPALFQFECQEIYAAILAALDASRPVEPKP